MLDCLRRVGGRFGIYCWLMLLGGVACTTERRNHIGIEYLPADEVHGGPGVIVTAIYPCTFAQRTGLRLGDVITSIGNQSVSGENLPAVLDGLALNENVTLGVRRGKERVYLYGMLGSVGTKSRPRVVPYSGIAGWNTGVGPLVVACVEPDSPVSRAGLLPGDTITTIGGLPVTPVNFEDVLGAYNFGTVIPFEISRNGVSSRIEVTLADFDALPQRLKVLDVTDMRQTLGRVIDVEPMKLDNCYGNAILERKRSIYRKNSARVDLTLSADLKAYGLLPFLLAEGKINSALDIGTATESGETKEEVLRANPGTVANYVIRWYEVSTTGTVAFELNGRQHAVPFVLTNRLRGEVQSLPPDSCAR